MFNGVLLATVAVDSPWADGSVMVKYFSVGSQED